MLFLALSCLQGRPMAAAANDLLQLGPVGLQLTPGCVPTTEFGAKLADAEISTRTHHGFHFDALRQKVWDGTTLLAEADSVHPPRCSAVSPEQFLERAAAQDYAGVALETMYPGQCLGTGKELDAAMDLRLPLAVDVSHIYMQLSMRVMNDATWRRLQDYDSVVEVHLSSNDGTRDQHRPVDLDTYGMAWATERAGAGTPVIIENYMHRQPHESRRQMVDLVLAEIDRRS